MPFSRSRKKAAEIDVAANVTRTQTEKKALTEDELFDIAFNNYKKMNPGSKMKRRDFRRNIWDSKELSDYLSADEYALRQSHLSGESVERFRQQISSEEPIPAEKTALIDDTVSGDEGPAFLDMPEQNLDDTKIEPLTMDDAYMSAESDVSQVEPAFDDHFLDDILPGQAMEFTDTHGGVLDAADEPAVDGDIHVGDILSELPDVPKTVIEAGKTFHVDVDAAGICAVGEDVSVGEAADVDDETSGVLENMSDTKAMSMSTEAESALLDTESTDDEGNVVMDAGDGTKAREGEAEEVLNAVDASVGEEVSAILADPETEEEVSGCDTEIDADTEQQVPREFSGIFSKEGVMERLRRSIYLDETDNSRDDELLELSPREVFEQLIRLEGCVHKVGKVGDLAEFVFTAGRHDDETEPTKERLLEIISNAVGAISYLMHFSCDPGDSDLWNNEICEHLGLTQEERQMQLFSPQEVNTQYIIRHSESENGQYEDMFYLATGDYTQVCRALFIYERAYADLSVKDIEAFLHMYGIQTELLAMDNVPEYSEDLIVENGRVFIN